MKPYLDIRPPLPPGVYRRPKRPLPFPFEDPSVRVFARARAGLWHAAGELLEPGDQVLVPPYHHGSEIEALHRAGATCAFYRQTGSLEPDEDHVAELAGPKVRALYLIHYLGFPADSARWRAWCDERGLLLFEDAAMAWLSSRDGVPAGSLGDAAIYCVYKSVGVPDGGVVRSTREVPSPTSAAPLGAARIVRLHGDWAAARLGPVASLRRALQKESSFSPAEEFALADPQAPPSRATLRLLPRLAGPEVGAGRREHFRFLLERLGERVPDAFRDVTDGTSPFVFPVRTSDKAAFLRTLRARGVAGLDLWSVPHPLLPVDQFPDAAALRASVVGLPVHQELRPADLRRIAHAATVAR